MSIDTPDNSKRYAAKFLNPTSGTEIHSPFTPLSESEGFPRDRFGNRFIKSSLSYLDRDNRAMHAGLLISRDGESFIKSHRGILTELDKGLVLLETDQNQNQSGRPERVILENDRTLEVLSEEGNQSHVYLLTTNGERYVVKTSRTNRFPNFTQPFVNEMLQCQAIAIDLTEELDKLGVEMPKFLFASGQVGCRRFEEGSSPSPEELMLIARPLLVPLSGYIKNQQAAGSSLWKGIKFEPVLKIENFIRKTNGNLVWVDPLFHEDPEDPFNHSKSF